MSAKSWTNWCGRSTALSLIHIYAAVTSEFVGYDHLTDQSKVTVLTTDTDIVEALTDGQMGTIFVEKTPFYATMGGQEGDKGEITLGDAVFQVEDTIKLLGGKIGHVGRMTKGMIKTGDVVTLSVHADVYKRQGVHYYIGNIRMRLSF